MRKDDLPKLIVYALGLFSGYAYNICMTVTFRGELSRHIELCTIMYNYVKISLGFIIQGFLLNKKMAGGI